MWELTAFDAGRPRRGGTARFSSSFAAFGPPYQELAFAAFQVDPAPVRPACPLVSAAQLEAFARALCEDDAEAESFALRLLARAPSLEAVQEELLAPAARRLEAWWAQDLACFATVTLGMAALQRVAWALSRAAPPPPPPAPGQRRLLLACAPGERRGFGLNLLHEQLRRRGGRPTLLAYPSQAELEAAVGFGGFEAVGLWVATAGAPDPPPSSIPALARALRQASPAPLRLLVCGPAAEALRLQTAPGEVDEVLGAAPLERLCASLFRDGCEPLHAPAAA